MKFLEYLLEQYAECTERAEGFEGEDVDDSFSADIEAFFDSLIIWQADVKNIAAEFGDEIMMLSIKRIAEKNLDPKKYVNLDNFVRLSMEELLDENYNKFKKVFL